MTIVTIVLPLFGTVILIDIDSNITLPMTDYQTTILSIISV